MSIKIEKLCYTYQAGTPNAIEALKNINLEIEKGSFIGLIGHTGSGKSTLIQHLNGLIKPKSGKIYIDGVDISEKNVKMKEIRKRVGLVFQYPEHQLFEETVFKDIAFGPGNLDLTEEEVKRRVKKAMIMVGLSYSDLKEKSPFELSGGQKRRVAIAGVLAMGPEYLILDEPTAGLDPLGRNEILARIKKLHKKLQITTILVTHSMDEVARLADYLVVMNNGEIILQGKPREVFQHKVLLESAGLGIPTVTKLLHRLKEEGMDISTDIIDVLEAKDAIKNALEKRGSV